MLKKQQKFFQKEERYEGRNKNNITSSENEDS